MAIDPSTSAIDHFRAGATNPTVAYAYKLDGALASETYFVPETPNVSYRYTTDAQDQVQDPLGRLQSVVDGIGTRTFTYRPLTAGTAGAGQLESENGPFADDTIVRRYDWRDRVEGTDLKSDAGAILRAETTNLDSLGRVSTIVSDALGTTTYGYSGTQRRPATVTGPNFVSSYTYYADNDPQKGRARQLASITHQVGGATIAGHTYGYDAAGRINSWEQVRSGLPTATWKYGYNGADELIAARRTDATSAVLDDEHWTYDAAGNWLSHTAGAAMQTRAHNSLNQITSLGGAGTTTVEGTINELAAVNVTVTNASGSAIQPASVSVDPAGGYRFRRDVPVVVGSNTVNAVAVDQQNEQSTASRTFNVAAAGASFVYDANGNTRNDGQRTFTWDGKNRLKTVTKDGTTWKWDYDYQDRRVREYANGAVTKVYVWERRLIAEERDTSTGSRRANYRNGFRDSLEGSNPMNYSTFADHLGNVSAVVEAQSGALAARYDYGPYRAATPIGVPSVNATTLMIGRYLQHGGSGLQLSMHRAYDARFGRWTSRDTLEGAEKLRDGPNLYRYVRGNPLNLVDYDGQAASALALAGVFAAADGPLPVGDVIATGILIYAAYQYFNDECQSKGLPPGFWPGDAGAREWGIREGVGARRGCPDSMVASKSAREGRRTIGELILILAR